MIALALALAYLGTLAAACWLWREARKPDAGVLLRLESLEQRSAGWDVTAGDVETVKIAMGLKARAVK